jgi:hypothetical protein
MVRSPPLPIPTRSASQQFNIYHFVYESRVENCLCGVSGILIWIFLHRRLRRFYAARRSEARASGHFLPFSSPAAARTRTSHIRRKTSVEPTSRSRENMAECEWLRPCLDGLIVRAARLSGLLWPPAAPESSRLASPRPPATAQSPRTSPDQLG